MVRDRVIARYNTKNYATFPVLLQKRRVVGIGGVNNYKPTHSTHRYAKHRHRINTKTHICPTPFFIMFVRDSEIKKYITKYYAT